MPFFFAPAGPHDGYENFGVVPSDANSVGSVKMIEGALLTVGLKDGAGLAISMSVATIALNVPHLEKPGPGGSRLLKLSATKAGTCQLIAKTADGATAATLDIVVVAARKSVISPKLTLSPLGKLSMADANKWIKDVEASVKLVSDNPVGKIVLKYVPDVVVIPDFVDTTCNASSLIVQRPTTSDGTSSVGRTVQFSPSLCNGSGAGDRPDEGLVHELIHQVEDHCSEYKNVPDPAHRPDPGFEFDGSDFMTITITNLYSSSYKRPLRKDHASYARLPQSYVSSEVKYFTDFRGNFVSLNRRLSAFYRELIFVEVPWDPFQEIRP